MSKIYILGISGNNLDDKARDCIHGCHTLFCSSRQQKCFDFGSKKVLPLVPLAEMLTRLETEVLQGDVAVLASGDPLFFGIGRRLLTQFGRERVAIIPALSSLQLAASLFKIPWDDAVCLSMHGRGDIAECGKLLNYPKVFVLTDVVNSPNSIANHLLKMLAEAGENISVFPMVYIAENLGLDDERLTMGTLEKISTMTFGPLNIMALVNPAAKPPSEMCYGLVEEEIFHSRGLITKNEVRAATLHTLRLPCAGVFWDIGSGSGSIAIEAAMLSPDLRVIAIEKESEQLANIRKNRQKYNVFNLEVIAGTAPDALENLPAPDRVFIGGSGGNLAEIIATSTKRLVPGGRIVINGVLEKTKTVSPQLLFEAGLQVTISEIAVSRHCYPSQTDEKTTFNPISIMCGEK